jgi:hypothetical protein
MSTLDRLQAWYADQCDGEWEHRFGVRIETLDNPGWQVHIDVAGTALAGRVFTEVRDVGSELEWIHCKVVDGRFEAFGGPHMLDEILQRFLQWASEPGSP